MRRLRALLFLLALALTSTATPARAAEVPCGSHTQDSDPGKTPIGFWATASDGCHTQRWDSTIGQGPGSGTLTFKTVGNIDPWEAGYTLPGPAGGPAAYCKYRAAHEANGFFTNKFQVPPGTEITITYRCD